MNDHERFLLLAAKRIGESLTRDEQAQLEVHLAACPSCRSIAAGMRRDDMRLRGELTPVPVSSRVRERVLAEASGSSRRTGPMILLLAAALALSLLGLPLIAGALREPSPSDAPPQSVAHVSPPSSILSSSSVAPPPPSIAPSPSVAPSQAPLPAGSGPFVAGNYTYGIRRDTLAARINVGAPAGEWWRTTTVSGKAESYGGPITCLVFDGKDAYLAGPATTATDGRSDLAMYFHLHDGGPDGDGDAAIGYLTNIGQTLTTMQTWCETKYTPTGPFPLTSGDIVVEPDG